MSATAAIAALATAAVFAIPSAGGAPATGTTSYAPRRDRQLPRRRRVLCGLPRGAPAARGGPPLALPLLVHSGASGPGDRVTISYQRADTGREVHVETVTVGRTGRFGTRPTDLREFVRPGDILVVTMHHESALPTAQQDLIEYALMAAFISP